MHRRSHLKIPSGIKKVSAVACAGGAVLALAGCGSTWHHTTITHKADAARQLVIDDGYCTQVAAGTAPMPDVALPPPPTTTNITMTGSTYNTTTGQRTYGTYTGQATTTPAGGFAGGLASGMAQGVALGALIRARQDQERIHKSCMFAKGWSDEPTNTVTTSTVQGGAQVTKTVEPKTSAPGIYASAKDEWMADIGELMVFYPAYKSGALHDWLDGKVRSLAGEMRQATGPQILLAAHAALVKAGQGAPEPNDEDLKSALLFYRGAVAGKPMDQAALGSMYKIGSLSTQVSPTRSAFWLQKAALSGNSVGQMGYGILVYFGNGVKQDRIEGYRWVQKAAATDADAKKVLKDFEGE